MWTPASASAFNAFADGYDWDFTGFRKTDGYVAVPLDGVWLRAPYLHNGSVPSLHDLLEPPDGRPKAFHRGYDLYDPARVGFVSDRPDRRARRHALRHRASRQRQRRPPVRHDPDRRGEASPHRIFENAVRNLSIAVTMTTTMF